MRVHLWICQFSTKYARKVCLFRDPIWKSTTRNNLHKWQEIIGQKSLPTYFLKCKLDLLDDIIRKKAILKELFTYYLINNNIKFIFDILHIILFFWLILFLFYFLSLLLLLFFFIKSLVCCWIHCYYYYYYFSYLCSLLFCSLLDFHFRFDVLPVSWLLNCIH